MAAPRARRTHIRTHGSEVERGSITVVCRSPGSAHALRHELDKRGALSKRKGRVVRTTASSHDVQAALRAARRTPHRGMKAARRAMHGRKR
jgi:hypothetical protein